MRGKACAAAEMAADWGPLAGEAAEVADGEPLAGEAAAAEPAPCAPEEEGVEVFMAAIVSDALRAAMRSNENCRVKVIS
jgi:hypothetical protein